MSCKNIIVLCNAFFLIVLVIGLYVINAKSSKKHGVLILGLCDSGKTLLFSLVSHLLLSLYVIGPFHTLRKGCKDVFACYVKVSHNFQ